MSTTKAPASFNDYAVSLDYALRGIMSQTDYMAKKEPKSALREPPASLPRTIADRANLALTQTDFERIMGTNDLVGVEYLAQGMAAAAAVARLLLLDPSSGQRGYATGFMVSPRLLLTNRHVLPDIGVAYASQVEFNYEYGANGMPKGTDVFKLEPDEVFIIGDANNQDADFALVAVASFAKDSKAPLSKYGYLRLDDQPGKIAEQEFITIIQHPGGQHKQIALRENEVIGKGANNVRPVLLYRSDTAPGSSGSPCFNDQWQVVALHSKGVLKTEDGRRNPSRLLTTMAGRVTDLQWDANLGVRISFIVDSIRRTPVAVSNQLLADFLSDVQRGGSPIQPGAAAPVAVAKTPLLLHRTVAQTDGSEEAGRALATGYDPGFLDVKVQLPQIGPKAKAFGSPLVVPGTRGIELKYTHFSVIMNKQRRLAFVSACNIDGALKIRIDRDNQFRKDPRIGEMQQTDNFVYADGGGNDNFFDRGHLTRRDDVCWGVDETEAQAANRDSFFFPNVAPQHKGFNQGKKLWQGLENYILENTVEEGIRASVFTGPVFSVNDLAFKGVPIPKEFWKLVVVADPTAGGQLLARAFILSQAAQVTKSILEDLAARLGVSSPKAFKLRARPEEMLPVGVPDGVELQQVTVAELQDKTGLVFDAVVHDADVMANSTGADEAFKVHNPITSYADIV